MRIGEFRKRHTLFAGLLAVLVPLTILLVVQFVWLLRLERAQAIAHAAALDGFLGTVATKVEYFYREAAERSVNERSVKLNRRIAVGIPASRARALTSMPRLR